MKKYILATILTGFIGILAAQEVISSAGNYSQVSGIQLFWTIGEPVIETVSVGNNILTQGFHQSKLTVTLIISHKLDFLIKVYPNPMTQRIYIEMNSLKKLEYELYDLKGKIMKQGTLESERNLINAESLANGTYYLKVMQKNRVIQSYKLIKMY